MVGKSWSQHCTLLTDQSNLAHIYRFQYDWMETMENYLRSLAGSQVTKFATNAKAGQRILLELHLVKQGRRTVLTVDEYTEYPTCRWIDDRLLVLGHFASLMKEVVKTEMVELELITAEDVHGNFQALGRGHKWIAFTHIVLKWKDYKVFLGDVESDDVLTSGLWPPTLPFEQGSYAMGKL